MTNSDWQCVAHNPQTGVSTWIAFDDDGIIIQERQEVSALLDENRAQFNMASGNWIGDGYYSVARVPLAMAHEKGSLIGGAIQAGDDTVVKRILNDADNSKLRTKGGVL